MFKLKNLLPKEVYKTVFDIDYNKLYEAGKRIILMDIDNTLVSYAESEPGEKLMALFKRIKEIGFEIIFISNNHKKRVETFAQATGSRYIENALKPFKRGYRKALKLVKPFGKDAIVSIGDQLVTDILGSNRFGIDAYLVKPIAVRTEKWYTRLNRKIENYALRKIKKHYPEVYRKFGVWDE